jgi:pyruvate/2-oxoglutarate dehydrogenase complex dihydrolipoamide dehydrogenase (E3) component/uncharacterized membrane protein YdjX (TVP38/TMEM64 family)
MTSPNPPPAGRRALLARLVLVAAVAAAVIALLALDLPQRLSLEALRDGQEALLGWRERSPLALSAGYVLVYVLVTALSLPGAAVLTLAGGAIFGLGLGTLLVSFASSAGALLAFLLARYLFRDLVERRFGRQLEPIREGVRRDGVLYLLTLRLAPVFPFFLVNLLMALTPMPAGAFYLTSQVGMLPGTLVYVNAGTQLAHVHDLAGILSPPVLLSLGVLAVFPWIGRAAVRRWQSWRLYRNWPRPKRFDRNLIVIGAGAAGLVTAYIAATVRAKVTLIEAAAMGGDCLNTGCVPSKALIRSARLAARMRHADRYGLTPHTPPVAIRAVMERVDAAIAAIAPHDSAARYRSLGVEVVQGHGRLLDPWTVAIRRPDGGEERLTARAIVLATGAAPWVPELPGADSLPVLTSETIWDYLRHCPVEAPRVVVLGGGPIGCELAQALAQLGLEVTQVLRGERLLRREDDDVVAVVRQALEADGVRLLPNRRLLGFEPGVVLLSRDGGEERIPCDAVLCALGRRARLQGFGLEELGIPTDLTITTDGQLQTLFPNIYAAGDAAGPFQYTHAAAHQAWYAAVNALFGDFRRFRVDERVIPRTTFTDPEVAAVGLGEAEAERRGIAVEVTRYPLQELDRAIVESEERGFVKVLTVPGRDTILGAVVVGERAGEMLAEFVLAMKWGLGLGRILDTLHAYPTWTEANKVVAGAWKMAHAPRWALRLLERFHAWRLNP